MLIDRFSTLFQECRCPNLLVIHNITKVLIFMTLFFYSTSRVGPEKARVLKHPMRKVNLQKYA